MINNALTVTQVNTYIKALLDEDIHLKNIFIVGEISNFLHYFRSGHIYFTLKDENTQIKAVMFSSSASRLKFKPCDGMKVLCRGRISLYDKDGAYQLYVDDMQPDGIGSLTIAFEQMKEKLLSLPGGEQYSLHGACQDNWIYALNFGKETVQVIDTSEWMGRSYELIAVLYTHKPTEFQFTNYCIRPAGIISSSSRHDLLLYDWAEHQAGADSY